MTRAPATSRDIALRAGVSQSAVSRVFTPGASASPAMAARVRRAATELGYRPNVLARSLITGRSRIIGLIVAYLDNQFYPMALELLSNALQARGYHILIFTAANSDAASDAVLEDILAYQVDGIMLASASISTALAARCDAAGVPVVLFKRHQNDGSGARLTSVASDSHAGGRRIAELLLACGHARIGWEGASTAREREAGFVAGLAAAGRSLHARAEGMFDRAAAMAAARRLRAA